MSVCECVYMVVSRITFFCLVCVTWLYTGSLVYLMCVCLCEHGSVQDHLPMYVKAKSQYSALLISSKMGL